ncbi:MAG TPA: SBBP repeat-containing protein [Bryobacteraceae bacterium]|nr:SBBP repeat-containing protein [Bryobacteraceae bacterium]
MELPRRYITRGAGYLFHVDARQNLMTWTDSGYKMSLRTKFVNARRDARVEGGDLLQSRTNYFLGNAPRRWRTNVSNYGEVRVKGLYPGIDLVYHGAAGTVEYDFVLHPGSDPNRIELQLNGTPTMRVDAAGNLVLATQVRWNAPLVYQEAGGQRVRVDGRFALIGRHRVRFHVGEYDRSRDLVIDPTLSYSSFVGGSGDDTARGIATDPQGNVYLAGLTRSTNLPIVAAAFQASATGHTDAFVAKFSAAGKLTYMTYLGGAQIDVSTSIAVDASGNAYVTGMTQSTDFPVTSGSYQKAFAGGGGGTACEQAGDGFITKLSPSGSQLVYSTYIGGSLDDLASSIAVDSAGNAYITGYTLSKNFPVTPGAYQTSFRGMGGQISKPGCKGVQSVLQPWFVSGDAFVAKLNPAGSQLVFATYLGGSSDEFGLAIAIDRSQNVYVGGFTLSYDFPVTPGAVRTRFGGNERQNIFFTTGDGFITKLNSSGSALIYSTYLGASGDDMVTALAVASDGSVWATGSTSSQDFPITSHVVQTTYSGYYIEPFLIEQLLGDAFATHVSADGSALLYSTYLGGAQNDLGLGIGIDSLGLVYVVGFTDSLNFLVTPNALQRKFGGDGGQANYFEYGDGFVVVIDPIASRLVYSSYFGGSQDDQLWGLALTDRAACGLPGILCPRICLSLPVRHRRRMPAPVPTFSSSKAILFLSTSRILPARLSASRKPPRRFLRGTPCAVTNSTTRSR